jgi:Flp pilus assembly protein TadD
VSAPVRRNDPCPCGSGRRYKECHGKLAEGGPEPVDTLIPRALRLHQEGRVAEAEALYREVLSRDAGHAVALHYLGMAAWQRGDAATGERLMRAAIEVNAAIPDFHNNLGLLLRDTGRAAEAVECYARTLEVDPGWFEAHNNRGLALEDLGRFEDAIDAYVQAVSREPRFAAARQNLARVLLALGRYAEGWEEYRWRLVAQGMTAAAPDARAPRLPASLKGRRIELVGEQGLGDVLFFLRFAPELVHRGAILAFRGDPRLHPLLARSALFAGGFQDPAAASAAGAIFAGDLPWLLEAHDPATFPPALALEPLADRVARLRATLDRLGPAPRIAITWRAGIATGGGPVRLQLKKAPVAALGEALHDTRATWLSIQRHPAEGEREALAAALDAPVHDFSAANDDLDEMLALLCLVDDYVGVSNLNTHLRAGLGRAMRVLVPFPPEWRWGIEGAESDWFPGMKVHRQGSNADWSGAMEELRGSRRRNGRP